MKKNTLQAVQSWLIKGFIAHIFLVFSGASFANVFPTVGQGVLQEKITLHVQDMKIKNVLKAIEKRCSTRFGYQHQIFNLDRKVTLSVEESPLIEVLNKLFDNAVSFEDMGGLVIIKRLEGSTILGQPVKGKVIDEMGAPVPGVNIVEKGISNGTITDMDGTFSLEVTDSNSILVFSFIGYESSEEVVGARASLNIVLKSDIKKLEEVVVVGYGTQRAKYLSSSVSTVSGEKLRDVTSNSVSSLLQGKAPGVVVSSKTGDPTEDSNILVRGATTISAGSGPLIVVDGNIGGTYNPTDVESITILKDAAAAGLYGSRAGNGVIIITTKTGKSGKTKIDFSSIAGVNEATTGNFKLMNTQQLYDYHKTYTTPDPAVLNTNTDWWDLAFRIGKTQRYSLSASGGTDKTKYYVSGSYYKEEGTLLANDRTVYNFRTNLTTKLSNKLKLSVLLNGIYTKDNKDPTVLTAGAQGGSLYGAYTNMPYDLAFNADGTPRDPRTATTWYGRDKNNFLQNLQYNIANVRRIDFSGDLNFDYTITEHFSFATYNRVSVFDSYDMIFFDRRSQRGGVNGGELRNNSLYRSLLVSSNRLRYDNSFEDHNIAVLAVGEVTQSYSDLLGTAVKGLPPGRPQASNAIDIITSPTGEKNEYSFHKYLVQADYNFANRYFVVASFVRDRSSRFGNNNPGANFYQSGVSWVISNEAFMQSFKSINHLKIRASYGTMGNAEIGDYASLGLYSLSAASSYAGIPGATPSQKGNPNLTWEMQKAANIGLDINLWDRIDLSIDVYQKISTDLLYRKPLPATSGYSFVWENVGSVRNKGIEFNLTTKNIAGKLFTWETNLNMAFNRNKVMALNEGAQFSSPGLRQPVGLGHDMNEWNMPVWAGVDPANGDPLWEKVNFDAEGKQFITTTNSYNTAATATSRQFLGKSSTPKFTGGITNTFAYKRFSLSAFMNFVYGNYVYNETRFYFDNDGVYTTYNSVVLAEGWSRWAKPGDMATHPKPVLGGNKMSNQQSSRYLEDGSYIRLRNVTLGYDLPVSTIGKLKFSSVRVFISGDNLWTGTKYTGPDPEVVLSEGMAAFRYPTSRKILLGLNVSF